MSLSSLALMGLRGVTMWCRKRWGKRSVSVGLGKNNGITWRKIPLFGVSVLPFLRAKMLNNSCLEVNSRILELISRIDDANECIFSLNCSVNREIWVSREPSASADCWSISSARMAISRTPISFFNARIFTFSWLVLSSQCAHTRYQKTYQNEKH